jgi:hypothetical protein
MKLARTRYRAGKRCSAIVPEEARLKRGPYGGLLRQLR